MLNKDYTTKLLDMEDVIITNVENVAGELHVCLELPRKKHACPACGALTDRVHDYRMQTVKDIPLGRKTLLYLRKRRYRCPCGKRFYEENPFLPKYYRVTGRLVAAIISAFRKMVPASEIGAQYNVSGATAARYFKCVSFQPAKLPEVLSIDEFKGNSGGEKYNSIIVDAAKHKVVDILSDLCTERGSKAQRAGFRLGGKVDTPICTGFMQSKEKIMRRTNINAVLRMVKQFLTGKIDATSFWLDFPHEVSQRYDSIYREDPEYAEMIMYYLVECGTDHYHELSEDDFRELIQAQYDNVMEGVY